MGAECAEEDTDMEPKRVGESRADAVREREGNKDILSFAVAVPGGEADAREDPVEAEEIDCVVEGVTVGEGDVEGDCVGVRVGVEDAVAVGVGDGVGVPLPLLEPVGQLD